MKNGRTFVKVTNEDIYQKIIIIDGKLERLNASSKLNRWIGTTALTLVIALIFQTFL